MDLSGLIFVALALAWACYLLPRALRRSDADAVTAPADTSSERARVLTRTPAMMQALLAEPEPVDPERRRADKAALKASEAERRAALARPASGGAAVRRRRVLLVLVLLTAGVGAAAGLGYLPVWTPAVPAALVLGWLVLCVRMAKAERRRAVRVAPRSVPALVEDDVVEDVPAAAPAAQVVDPATDEDGRLWDPLPITLPTYVGKPVARRTARAIDLAATTSSGHDAAASALARRVRAAGAPVAPSAAPVEERRAAGA